MGLIVPQTVRIKTSSSNYKYFLEKGYKIEKCGNIIEVDVLDLKRSCKLKVKCKCGFCGKINPILSFSFFSIF